MSEDVAAYMDREQLLNAVAVSKTTPVEVATTAAKPIEPIVNPLKIWQQELCLNEKKLNVLGLLKEQELEAQRSLREQEVQAQRVEVDAR